MKLSNKDFKRFKDLSSKLTDGTLTESEKKELTKLTVMRGDNKRSQGNKVGNKYGGNDIKWWNKYPNLTSDAANLVFNEVAGTAFDFNSHADTNAKYLPVGVKIPYIFTIGKSPVTGDISPINMQMRDLWLTMHRKYRGLGSYEYSDLGMALQAIFAFFADIARAERMYGCLKYYNVRNRSYPTTLLHALDLNYVFPGAYSGDQIADFRYNLNRIIVQAKTLCLPKGFSILDSLFTIQSQVFKDSDSDRAIWYLYDNQYKMQYNATKFTTGGCVEYLARAKQSGYPWQTFTEVISDLNDQLGALINDTDIARMCSDILACFGESGVVKLIEMPEDYQVQPIKDDTRLLQLHNTTIMPKVVGTNIDYQVYSTMSGERLDIYQVNGKICQELAIGAGSNAGYTNRGGTRYEAYSYKYTTNSPIFDRFHGESAVLDIWKDDVSKDDVVEATRQSVTYETKSEVSGSETLVYHALTAYGPIVCRGMYVYNAYQGGSQVFFSDNHIVVNNSAAVLADVKNKVIYLSKLDWAPVFQYFDAISNSSTDDIEGLFGDLDNYTVISSRNLERLHETCFMSGWKMENTEFTIKE